jgi:hypothetical protein
MHQVPVGGQAIDGLKVFASRNIPGNGACDARAKTGSHLTRLGDLRKAGARVAMWEQGSGWALSILGGENARFYATSRRGSRLRWLS